jgi:uncharacterized protein YuzE
MAALQKNPKGTSNVQDHTSSTVMLEAAENLDNLPLMAVQNDILIDFDAKQEAIGITRRSAGEAHTITRRTRAKPSKTEPTEI